VEENLGPGDKDSDRQKMYELAMVKGQVSPNALSYSGQTVLSISDYRKRQNAAMATPRSLKGNGGQWVITNWLSDCIYEMDPIDSLDLVGIVTKKKLVEKQGLVTVKDIRDMLREEM
jgi:hypothetical protein